MSYSPETVIVPITRAILIGYDRPVSGQAHLTQKWFWDHNRWCFGSLTVEVSLLDSEVFESKDPTSDPFRSMDKYSFDVCVNRIPAQDREKPIPDQSLYDLMTKHLSSGLLCPPGHETNHPAQLDFYLQTWRNRVKGSF